MNYSILYCYPIIIQSSVFFKRENYNFLKFETGEYCSFSVGGERRRVYLKNPTNDNFDEDIIVEQLEEIIDEGKRRV